MKKRSSKTVKAKQVIAALKRQARKKGIQLLAIRYRQVGQSNRAKDAKIRALPPGKRRSRTGRIYWETRKNRSDWPGRLI